MILDSNIVIYSTKSEFSYLLEFLKKHPLHVSAISTIEVLGHHALKADEKILFETFFKNTRVLPISELIVARAIELRQKRKLSLGDSLVAATALCHALPIATRNVGDFNWVAGLTVINPIR